jgi:hypothetical protein
LRIVEKFWESEAERFSLASHRDDRFRSSRLIPSELQPRHQLCHSEVVQGRRLYEQAQSVDLRRSSCVKWLSVCSVLKVRSYVRRAHRALKQHLYSVSVIAADKYETTCLGESDTSLRCTSYGTDFPLLYLIHLVESRFVGDGAEMKGRESLWRMASLGIRRSEISSSGYLNERE